MFAQLIAEAQNKRSIKAHCWCSLVHQNFLIGGCTTNDMWTCVPEAGIKGRDK